MGSLQTSTARLDAGGRIGVTLGRHINDEVTSFYANSPSGFMVEYGWGGRVIEPEGWQPSEVMFGPSLWGPDRMWQAAEGRDEARRLRLAAAAVQLRGLLWALSSGQPVPPIPKGTAAARNPAISASAYAAMGYRVLGNRVLRLDRVERVAAHARALARQSAFEALPELAFLAGCAREDLSGVLTDLGYRVVLLDGQVVGFRPARRGPARRRRDIALQADSPFAKLKELTLAR